jgi:hypothetical protein
MLFANNSTAGESMGNITRLDLDAIKKLESKAIYFGHHSVGGNILDGINSILSTIEGNTIRVVMTKSPDDISAGVFAHSAVGENYKPASKDEEFTANVTNISNSTRLDVALYKYCYVDIQKDTDVEALFSAYRKNYDSLIAANPGIKFIHLTTPLTIIQKDWKVWIKKLIGRPIGGYAENVKRGQFNEMLRKEYGDSGLVFDLAKLESTYPDGRRELFSVDGNQYEALIEDYASDGRHLNKTGSRYIAEQLLLFIINNT